MSGKWYSNKLPVEEVPLLDKLYAKIEDVKYDAPNPRGVRPLRFELFLEDGWEQGLVLNTAGDINQLLTKTHSKKIAQLEGKVVEAYISHKGLRQIVSISVNENLV